MAASDNATKKESEVTHSYHDSAEPVIKNDRSTSNFHYQNPMSTMMSPAPDESRDDHLSDMLLSPLTSTPDENGDTSPYRDQDDPRSRLTK